MAKFRRDDHDEPERHPAKSGSNIVLIAVLAAGGFVILLCAGIAAVGFFMARTTVREAEVMQAEVAERAAQIEAEQAAQDGDDVRDFKAKVAHYLTEARAGAKLLTLAPSVEDAKKKAGQITDLYTRLPDVPPEIDDVATVAERLKNINGSFAVAVEYVKLRDEHERLANRAGVEKMTQRFDELAAEVNRIADEIEAKLKAKPSDEP